MRAFSAVAELLVQSKDGLTRTPNQSPLIWCSADLATMVWQVRKTALNSIHAIPSPQPVQPMSSVEQIKLRMVWTAPRVWHVCSCVGRLTRDYEHINNHFDRPTGWLIFHFRRLSFHPRYSERSITLNPARTDLPHRSHRQKLWRRWQQPFNNDNDNTELQFTPSKWRPFSARCIYVVQ